MYKQKILTMLLSSYLVGVAYADNVQLRDVEQTNIQQRQITDEKQLQEDFLRKQTLVENSATPKSNDVNRYTGRQLIENPEVLERLFADALISGNKELLPTLSQLYKLVPTHDSSLIEWADAQLLMDKDPKGAVAAYRKLITNFPDNNFIRFQLASVLFYNQEFEAAKTQFEKLRAAPKVLPQDMAVYDEFINAINNKDQWNLSFGATFLNDKNLDNRSPQGTVVTLPDGSTLTNSSPNESGQGVSVWLGADKRWGLNNGFYLINHNNISSKYYWDNKKYNDVNGYIDFGFGYSDARFNIELTPYLSKRWYAGGSSGSKSLKRYNNTYGSSLSSSYWITPSVKYSLNYNYGYDRYSKDTESTRYNGANHSLSNSILYLPNTKQYWSIALDLSHKGAKSNVNAYDRIGGRLTWGQEWPLGISTSISGGIAKRKYKEADFWGKKQSNTEYFSNISLWHKELHFGGLTPRITWNYSKTKSNISFYSYDKHQIFIDVSKSF